MNRVPRPTACETARLPCAKVKATVVKTALLFVPPGVDLIASHIISNSRIARKSHALLLHPKLVTRTAFFYTVEFGIDQSITQVDRINSSVAAGVLEGALSIVKFILLLL
jgi:hypothetical protein